MRAAVFPAVLVVALAGAAAPAPAETLHEQYVVPYVSGTGMGVLLCGAPLGVGGACLELPDGTTRFAFEVLESAHPDPVGGTLELRGPGTAEVSHPFCGGGTFVVPTAFDVAWIRFDQGNPGRCDGGATATAGVIHAEAS